MIYHHHHIHTCMYILICHVTFFCPPKDFAQATALINQCRWPPKYFEN